MNRVLAIFIVVIFSNSLTSNDLFKVEKSEFIFDELPHPSCHASSIVETEKGLVACWFGGKREGDPSVGIWVSLKNGKQWTAPKEVANGNQLDGSRFPSWNPVLFRMPKGELFLFYKVGPNPREWWGKLMRSTNGGQTWSAPKRLPKGILGPVKNKPILMKDGTLLCGSSTEHDGWKVHLEWSKDPWEMKSWNKNESLANNDSKGAIQPAMLRLENGYGILCRNQQKESILASQSTNGKDWSALTSISLPNPNSGIDSVTLKDGSHVLIYNDTRSGRSPISLAHSKDGKAWIKLMDLEKEPRKEFSYPAVIQTSDGKVHVTYTWKRQKIKHVVLVKMP